MLLFVIYVYYCPIAPLYPLKYQAQVAVILINPTCCLVYHGNTYKVNLYSIFALESVWFYEMHTVLSISWWLLALVVVCQICSATFCPPDSYCTAKSLFKLSCRFQFLVLVKNNPKHVAMFHYGQNSIRTLVGSPEYIYLGTICSYAAGWQ